MANEIAIFNKFGLSTSSNFSYSSVDNAFVGNLYISMSGRSYCNKARFIDGLVIKEDVGRNDYGTYLNGLHIYDINSRVLLCEEVFPMYCGRNYSKYEVMRIAKELLYNLIVREAAAQGCNVDRAEVMRKLSELISRCMEENQLEYLERNMRMITA